MRTDLQTLRAALEARAFLYDDPAAYLAGCEDALRAMEQLEPEQPAGTG